MLNVPVPQSVQVASAVVDPSVLLLPGPHHFHGVHEFCSKLSWLWNCLAVQTTQVASPVGDPSTLL